MESKKKLVLIILLLVGLWVFTRFSTKTTGGTTTPPTTGGTGGTSNGRDPGGSTDPDPIPGATTYNPVIIKTCLTDYINVVFTRDGSGGWVANDLATGYNLNSGHYYLYVIGNVVFLSGTTPLTNYPWPSNLPCLIQKFHYREPMYNDYSGVINRGYDINPGPQDVGAFQYTVFLPA